MANVAGVTAIGDNVDFNAGCVDVNVGVGVDPFESNDARDITVAASDSMSLTADSIVDVRACDNSIEDVVADAGSSSASMHGTVSDDRDMDTLSGVRETIVVGDS